MTEFFFRNQGIRRDRCEVLHDLLIAAKDGYKRTQLCSMTGYAWMPMTKLLKRAEGAGLIEEVEMLEYERYGRKQPAIVWQTTEKGLAYAKGVRENYQLIMQEVTA